MGRELADFGEGPLRRKPLTHLEVPGGVIDHDPVIFFQRLPRKPPPEEEAEESYEDVPVVEFDWDAVGDEPAAAEACGDGFLVVVDVGDDLGGGVTLPSTSSAYICRISFCFLVRLRGMLTSKPTKRSPLSPLLIRLGTPRPRSSISSPTCVPAGTRTSTSPSKVGTRTFPPNIAT